MTIADAQSDVRRVYRGGYTGPLVSAIVWALANAVYQFGSPSAAMATLFVGGMLIFPLSAAVLKITTGHGFLPAGHPSIGLAMQSAFTVPFGLLVAVALGSYEPVLFFPASLIIVGAHYFVFVSLYGMKVFAVLGGVLVTLGTAGMFLVPSLGAFGGWIGATVLLIFSPIVYRGAVSRD